MTVGGGGGGGVRAGGPTTRPTGGRSGGCAHSGLVHAAPGGGGGNGTVAGVFLSAGFIVNVRVKGTNTRVFGLPPTAHNQTKHVD